MSDWINNKVKLNSRISKSFKCFTNLWKSIKILIHIFDLTNDDAHFVSSLSLFEAIFNHKRRLDDYSIFAIDFDEIKCALTMTILRSLIILINQLFRLCRFLARIIRYAFACVDLHWLAFDLYSSRIWTSNMLHDVSQCIAMWCDILLFSHNFKFDFWHDAMRDSFKRNFKNEYYLLKMKKIFVNLFESERFFVLIFLFRKTIQTLFK